ncbi:hypothetical protein SLEP1_g17673 [Rubroshorea leprosula]|uniref:PWWP domain-containing protein n=1 Tax=Rubroshorea leprosula TaxID=152421 RepID=A0AAV5IV12_9ROSI|nr:hypothetical protein SLEP1_g17673 [Rubroshorea leprosula]
MKFLKRGNYFREQTRSLPFFCKTLPDNLRLELGFFPVEPGASRSYSGDFDLTKGFLMSIKADQIDLNSDASLVDRENDNEVSVAETVHVVGVSADETLMGSGDGSVQVQEQMVEQGGGFEGANESVGGDEKSDLVVDTLGKMRKMECVRSGIDLLAEVGSMGKEADGKGGDGDSLMKGEGAGMSECEQGISIPNEKELATMEIDEKPSSVEEHDINVNTCPVVGLNSIAEDSIQLGNACDAGSLSGDFDPNSSVLGSTDSLPSNTCVPEEGSFGGPEDHAMEIDNQSQINENQTQGIQSSKDGVFENNGNRPDQFDLVEKLDPYTNPPDDLSGDANNPESSASKPEFCVSDLVWGKVQSYPWWPGQIFAPSAATAKAKKYFKKDCYLIAYFGDHTFAWNEASRIKPFRPHFLHMEKQSSSEDFQYAIDCALEEVSRRIEYGLACSCILKKAYSSVQTQTIVNAGIREESSRIDGGDRFSNATSFEPSQLIKYIEGLAQSPYYSGINKLQFVASQAQLLAFYRWKGYSQLPEFKILGGLLESDADIQLSEEVKQCSKEDENAFPSSKVDQVSTGDGKPEGQDGSSDKQRNSGDSLSSKKEKSLSDFLAERRLNIKNGKKGLGGKAGDKSISVFSRRKRKAVDTLSGDLAPVVKHMKSNFNLSDDSAKSQSKQSFTIGASILRVASQLNGSSPIFKNDDGFSRKSPVKNKSTEKLLPRKTEGKRFSERQNSSPHEMLSQLLLAATDPLKEYSFLTSIVGYFTDLRNSIILECNRPEKHEQSVKIEDSSWVDRILKCLPEEMLKLECQNQAADILPETPSENDTPTVQPTSNLDSEPKSTNQSPKMEAEKPMESLNESSKEEFSPTALILNFTDLDSVPMVENLNKIFSRYGPLNESDTEVLEKSSRARVVFKRREDAETAFSSAGKYSIFGPSLVSYRLKYLPSTPHKASPGITKRGKKSTKSLSGGST